MSKKFPFYKQHDSMDCGATCLRMIARHYGRFYSLEYLRELTFIGKDGVALIDIADPGLKATRGQSLASVEQMALAGRFTPEMLHRLATVLDALDYQVPIPLWEAASKTPQPNTGHLPETGVLTELQDAAKKKEFARTVLLTLRTVGTGGAEGAHMIALGDAIRGLKRAGLEPDARRLGFEALFVAWPRAASN